MIATAGINTWDLLYPLVECLVEFVLIGLAGVLDFGPWGVVGGSPLDSMSTFASMAGPIP